MRSTFLPFSPPQIGDEERAAVLDTLNSTWITTGPKTKKFEEEFGVYVKAPQALALNSCTAALHVALLAADIGPGDEVITTPLTFCASVNVIEHVGARPVLVDVHPETLQLDARNVERALGAKTKAVMAVHYTGHPCDMDALSALSGDKKIFLIEDAAHALPAFYKDKIVGSIGDFTAFSFYATKNLTTAEGGMLTGRDEERMARARMLSLHGMSRDAWKRYDKGGSWFYEVMAPGFKYNMTDIQAALGLVQLRRLPWFQTRREVVVKRYNEAFGNHAALQIPFVAPEVKSAWHLYVLRLKPEALVISRDTFIDELQKRNIGTSVHFIPVHLHPYYRERYGFKPTDLPVAYKNYERSISLPLHPGLSDGDIDDVIEAVLDIAAKNKR